jgi:hypothetical protein
LPPSRSNGVVIARTHCAKMFLEPAILYKFKNVPIQK